MRRTRRLLIVVNDAGFFLSHRLPIALGAREAGYDVHIATPSDDAAAGIAAAGLPFHAIPLSRKGTTPSTELKAVRALVELYRALAPDIVHHVTAKPILYGGVAARVVGVPAVVHAVSGLGHVFISEAPRARVLRQGIRAAYRVVTGHPNCAVVFQNEDDRRTFGAAIRTKNVVVIPGSGVDRNVFRRAPVPGGVPIVVLPSRMLWDKGVGEFVEAARILRGRGWGRGGADGKASGGGREIRFALVGGTDRGNPAAIPVETLEAWVAAGDVEWWGQRGDMPAVLAEASVVCLPSYREGMPKALLEATAVGRAIVTTDVPGCRDVLGGGGTGERDGFGVLVPPRDARAIADAVESVVSDTGRLARMAEAAAVKSEVFAVEHVVERTLGVYRSLLE